MRYYILFTQLDEDGMRGIHILDRKCHFTFLYYTNEILEIPDEDMRNFLLNDWLNIIKGVYDQYFNPALIESFTEYHIN
ncbi:hypothetical protein [Halobacillus sp. B23F22_1]|uniref:hypothetical protein n=1 Tax=Halobacillus sp. B23F22_1 TaxID=3459514 RepID=UPI00373F1F1B